MRGTPEERFWAKVDKTPGHGPKGHCWIWTSAISYKGYGLLNVFGKAVSAHRFSWYLANPNQILGKRCVLHKCDNTLCVRPTHFFLGTQFENMQDMVAKGRQNKARGVSHSQCKLTEVQVLDIYYDTRIQREIAADHGIERTSVYHIKSGGNWSHVTGHPKKERRSRCDRR